MRSTFSLPLAALAAWLAFATLASAQGTPPPAGDAAKGKKLYATRCVACHKPDGSGGVKVTGNPTPDFRNAALMALPAHSDSVMRECITHGRPKSGMVAWSKQGVKPADIEHLIAYIRTFAAAKAAKKKP